MKVCLVIPPSATEFGDRCEATAPLVRQRIKEAPLGILSVASVARKHGADVSVLDLNTVYYDFFDHSSEGEDFASFASERLMEQSADVIGFGSLCSSYPFTLRMAEEVRRFCSSTPIILGGPQASVVDVASMRHFASIDIVVRGEADETFPAVLECLETNRSPALIPGITFRDGRRNIQRNLNAPPVHDLDALPMPAYDLFDNLSVEPSLSIEAGRGCPFACSFCSTNDFFRRRFRLKSPAKLVEQMAELEERYGATSFDFVHDMFTVDRKRVVQICEALLASGGEYYWSCSARTDCVDEELLELMALAGCRGVFYGIETGSPRMQKLIGKDLDLDRASEVIIASDRLGIPSTVSVIAGFPDEENADLAKTVSFVYRAARLDSVAAQIHLLAPLAETPIHLQYRDQLVLDDIYSDLSHQGWYQHPADRAVIGSYPDIFPNFYALPTKLNRSYARELCRFIYYSVSFCRWLVIGLEAWFGPLAFFDAWLDWRRRVTGNTDGGPRYYASTAFRREITDFVENVYSGDSNEEHAVRVLAAYERARLKASGAGKPIDRPGVGDKLEIGKHSRLRHSAHIAVFEIEGDVAAIQDCLRKGQSAPAPQRKSRLMSIRFNEPNAEISEESELSAKVLRLFEESCTVKDASDRFCGQNAEVAGVPGRTAFGFTLRTLLEREMLSVERFMPELQ